MDTKGDRLATNGRARVRATASVYIAGFLESGSPIVDILVRRTDARKNRTESEKRKIIGISDYHVARSRRAITRVTRRPAKPSSVSPRDNLHSSDDQTNRATVLPRGFRSVREQDNMIDDATNSIEYDGNCVFRSIERLSEKMANVMSGPFACFHEILYYSANKPIVLVDSASRD